MLIVEVSATNAASISTGLAPEKRLFTQLTRCSHRVQHSSRRHDIGQAVALIAEQVAALRG